MSADRIATIKALSQEIADICAQSPVMGSPAWARIERIQGEIEDQISLYKREEDEAFEAREGARIQAECDAGAAALRFLCTGRRTA